MLRSVGNTDDTDQVKDISPDKLATKSRIERDAGGHEESRLADDKLACEQVKENQRPGTEHEGEPVGDVQKEMEETSEANAQKKLGRDTVYHINQLLKPGETDEIKLQLVDELKDNKTSMQVKEDSKGKLKGIINRQESKKTKSELPVEGQIGEQNKVERTMGSEKSKYKEAQEIRKTITTAEFNKKSKKELRSRKKKNKLAKLRLEVPRESIDYEKMKDCTLPPKAALSSLCIVRDEVVRKKNKVTANAEENLKIVRAARSEATETEVENKDARGSDSDVQTIFKEEPGTSGCATTPSVNMQKRELPYYEDISSEESLDNHSFTEGFKKPERKILRSSKAKEKTDGNVRKRRKLDNLENQSEEPESKKLDRNTENEPEVKLSKTTGTNNTQEKAKGRRRRKKDRKRKRRKGRGKVSEKSSSSNTESTPKGSNVRIPSSVRAKYAIEESRVRRFIARYKRASKKERVEMSGFIKTRLLSKKELLDQLMLYLDDEAQTKKLRSHYLDEEFDPPLTVWELNRVLQRFKDPPY